MITNGNEQSRISELDQSCAGPRSSGRHFTTTTRGEDSVREARHNVMALVDASPPVYDWLAFQPEVVMRFFTALLTLALTACATQPVSIYQASAVPSSRILAPQLLSQAQCTGSLIIKRDIGFMGSACTIRVFVNAVPVADLAPSEKVEIFLPLGEHVVGATPTEVFCGGGTSEAAVVIRPESQRILRIASGQSGDIHLQPSAF